MLILFKLYARSSRDEEEKFPSDLDEAQVDDLYQEKQKLSRGNGWTSKTIGLEGANFITITDHAKHCGLHHLE